MLTGLAARRSGIPLVWGIHNSSFEQVGLASRLCAYAGGANARRFASFVINCSQHSSALHAKLGYSALANSVIANGYDASAFRPDANARAATRRALGIDDRTFAVGSVARWHPHKDIPTLLRAVHIASGAGVPLRCLLVGAGLDGSNQQLAAEIARHRCGDVVTPLGMREDVPELARALDLHVLSSRSEAFPNVVAETMLSGTPNLVTDVGDSAFIVGDTGWVVPAGDAESLAVAIFQACTEWSSKPRQWQTRQRAARNRIAQEFTFEKMAREYAAVWQRVAGNPMQGSSDAED
jgi:glycosyltransferase involved in cell wall biosynthesis